MLSLLFRMSVSWRNNNVNCTSILNDPIFYMVCIRNAQNAESSIYGTQCYSPILIS